MASILQNKLTLRLSILILLIVLTACTREPQKTTCDDSTRVLSMPILGSSLSQATVDYVYIASNYADLTEPPPGSNHSGIHLSPISASASAEIEYFAASDATITKIESQLSAGTHNVNVQLLAESGITLVYQFETQASQNEALVAQQSKIRVTEGQTVQRGDSIGILHDHDGPGGATHPIFHLGVINCDGQLVCPAGHFQAADLDTLTTLLNRDHPEWQLCYGD